MTRVTYVLNDFKITEIKVEGHSNFDQHGKDIVCASVSTLLQYSINLVDSFGEIKNIQYEINEAYVKIDVVKHTKTIDTIMDRLLCELEELSKEFPKNVKVKK